MPIDASQPLTRRHLLERGLQLGIVTLALMAHQDGASAAPNSNLELHGRFQVSPPETFTALISYGSPDIDPHSTYVTIGATIALGSYEMLIKCKGDSTSEFSPMLAESWQVSADLSTYTFKLPAGVKFHDGSACDAGAVKASFVRFIKMGLGPFMVAARFISDPDTQISAVDPTTVQFNLGKPEPLFLSAMASSYGPYIVSPTAVEKYKTDTDPWAHEWFLQNAVGTGPYRLIENSINEQVRLEKFDEYHGGWAGSHFTSIILRIVPENSTRRQLIEQRQVDAATNNVTPDDETALRTTSGVKVVEYASTSVFWAILNAVKLNVKARQGLSFAYPYDDVVVGAFKNLLVRTGPIARGVRAVDPDVYLYKTDLAKAKELLLAGGIAEGTTIDYMLGSEEEAEKSAAQLFQANLAKIGYTLAINQVDTATLNEVILGDQPAAEKPMVIASWGWFPDYNDPWNQLAPNFLKSAIGNGGGNGGAWSNDRFETIMAQAKQFTDEAQLVDLMKEAQNILTEQDPPAIYLGERQYFTVLRDDIQGFQPNPLYLDCYNYYEMSRGAAT